MKNVLYVFLIAALLSCKKTEVNKISPPVIESVLPKYIKNSDELFVILKLGSISLSSDIRVKIDGVEIPGQFGGNGFTIKFKVPTNFFSDQKICADIQVIVNGQESQKIEKAILSEFYPRFDVSTPEVIRKGEELTIYGYNFSSEVNKNNIQFLNAAGTFDNGIITYSDQEVIKVKVPTTAVSGSFVVSVITKDLKNRVVVLDSPKSIRVLNN
ncbi:IPT/TIG domain-containing protein [Pedobacter jejuensis]|uniref:IPT/TIG domain-containing protein n=1 Tax=Pedobacter jejuensis TaxID=1268550 RepID=A0A3N0BVF4_9SPHI|nr:IPT/TIG domain-containing protein [Pedobacter jejuensis]RNL53409.1 hypothetical protein D7004_10025 [Pedobacter jejuensis]